MPHESFFSLSSFSLSFSFLQMDRSADVTLSEGQILLRGIPPTTTFRTLHFIPFSFRQSHYVCNFGDPARFVSHFTELASTMIDGSSEGEIFLPPPSSSSRSNSTASFRSAAGSLGEVPTERCSTADDLESE